MEDYKANQIINGLLEILKTLLEGAQAKDDLAKQAALAKSTRIVKQLKP